MAHTPTARALSPPIAPRIRQRSVPSPQELAKARAAGFSPTAETEWQAAMVQLPAVVLEWMQEHPVSSPDANETAELPELTDAEIARIISSPSFDAPGWARIAQEARVRAENLRLWRLDFEERGRQWEEKDRWSYRKIRGRDEIKARIHCAATTTKIFIWVEEARLSCMSGVKLPVADQPSIYVGFNYWDTGLTREVNTRTHTYFTNHRLRLFLPASSGESTNASAFARYAGPYHRLYGGAVAGASDAAEWRILAHLGASTPFIFREADCEHALASIHGWGSQKFQVVCTLYQPSSYYSPVELPGSALTTGASFNVRFLCVFAGGMSKRKKASFYHFSNPVPTPASVAPNATASPSTARLLREKTTVRQTDRHVKQTRSVVNVAGGDEQRPVKVHPDVCRERAPLYDWYSGGDEGVHEVEDDDTAREPRDLDDPLRQWAEDHLDRYLTEVLHLEGRGDHATESTCPRCLTDGEEGEAGEEPRPADHRCNDCLGGGELICADCIVLAHRQLPFHWIEHWTGQAFEHKKLKDMGLRIQLGHWEGVNRGKCPVPRPAIDDDFVVVVVHGVHQVGLDYCGCGQGGHATVQLLRARLWAATTTNPKTAATFAMLRKYHLLSFESKCLALEFYQSLAREADNLRYKKDKVFFADDSTMATRPHAQGGRPGHDPEGIAKMAQGACALLCPTCPQPGKNLAPNWHDAPADKKFLHALFLALDANFRLKRKDVSLEEKDPGLGNGWAFLCEVKTYMEHRSHCVAHDAVDKPDREARGTASSGIGAVDCARHNMKRPNAVGDLQFGERYLNMDYMFLRSIAGTQLLRFFVSYDIACQWHIDIWNRMIGYWDATITIPGAGKLMTFLVPKFHLPAHIEACNLKFSFNLTPYVGQTDGEAPERGWANANPLARSTKEMGPGSRRDTLDDHFNDWNHKKIIALGYTLRRRTENAVPEMVKTKEALADMEESLGTEVVEEWTKMAQLWEANVAKPNPFETLRKDLHVAKVRAELAAEAAEREAAGQEDAGSVKGDMHITELIGMGLQLEDQHKLRRKIFAWIKVQTSFFLGLKNVQELEDAARARAAETQPIPGISVSDIKLWLPSAIGRAPRDDMDGVQVKKDIYQHEYRLRVGQAEEALHEVRRLLLVRTHLYQLKDAHSRGQIHRAAAQYRAARDALVTLGSVLKRREWERTLLELKEDDVRGLLQAMFHDPERKKKKRRKKKKPKVDRPPSWIWLTRGEQYNPADDAAMNEVVRIEWAKLRARSHCWAEEVDLLEEEMARVRRFLLWRSGWWTAQVGQRNLEEGPQLEGETSYALRQAAILATLASSFATEWKDLPELIQRGRAGELEVSVDAVQHGEASVAQEDDDGEEEGNRRGGEQQRRAGANPCLTAARDQVELCGQSFGYVVSTLPPPRT
ncbi:hypothetical protein B0H19DRAFT_1080876 [Mycena capillaripes]|nr:hypothetical protein B0H19DRAFT_1080876 [Mycena capillaripes]